jgi:hypothetical protein
MSVWGWVLSGFLSLAGLSALVLALLHVRYRAAWNGEWPGGLSLPHDGSLSLEFGFPGFMRAWVWPGKAAGDRGHEATRESAGAHGGASVAPAQGSVAREESGGAHSRAPVAPAKGSTAPAGSTPTVPDQGIARIGTPQKNYGDDATPPTPVATDNKDPNRCRKALFRLATDAPAWGKLARYGFRVLRLTHRLLRPHVEMAAGHPDPALLGRMAGYWHAASPLLPLGDAILGFRFQGRHPSFRVSVHGGFSALSLLCFGIGLVVTFPFVGLGRRAWHDWRHREPAGWRAWAYGKLAGRG